MYNGGSLPFYRNWIIISIPILHLRYQFLMRTIDSPHLVFQIESNVIENVIIDAFMREMRLTHVNASCESRCVE